MAFNALRLLLALLLLGAHGMISHSTGSCWDGQENTTNRGLKFFKGLFVATERRVSSLRCVHLHRRPKSFPLRALHLFYCAIQNSKCLYIFSLLCFYCWPFPSD